MNKTAVILFNLGGPDKPDAVQPFLFNLFNDPAIITLPQPFRYLIAKLISSRRAKIATAIYAKLGGGSPILPNTRKQADTLATETGNKTYIAMRYWRPFIEETIAAIKQDMPEQIILLPLYPQFSTTTTQSSLDSFRRAAQKAGLNIPTKTICCYPQQSGFISALANKIRSAYQSASQHGSPRILFSAHGLPEKIVAAGDPYPQHCALTVAALRVALNIDNLDGVLCYQSRVGPLAWIGPSTDDEIRRAGRDKVPVVIVPIAFVSEHSETLVEIDMEYRHLAAQSGVPFFAYSGTVADDPAFIAGLAELVQNAIMTSQPCISGDKKRICPNEICACPHGEPA